MPNPDAPQASPQPEVEEGHCDYCGDPTKLTGVVRDAWQNVEHEDSDVVTEDGHWCWTFTRPKQVRMHELSCGCWRLGEEVASNA